MRSLACAVILAAAVGCGSNSTPPPTAPAAEAEGATPAPTSEQVADAPELAQEPPAQEPAPELPEMEGPTAPVIVTVAATDPQVRVLERGKGRRAPLRYEVPTGATEQFDVDVQSRLTAPGMPSQLPSLHFTYDAEVTEVAPDGTMAMRLAVRDANATADGDATLVDEMNEAVRAVIGTTIVTAIGPRGRLAAQTYTGPETDEDVRGLVESLGQYVTWPVILPDADVAPGARWEVVEQIDLGGVPATATTVYTLEERTARGARITGETTIETEEKRVGDIELSKFEGKGTRTFELVEGRVFGKGTATQDVTLGMDTADDPIEMSIGWTIETTPQQAATSAR